jgi:hypothetical protein
MRGGTLLAAIFVSTQNSTAISNIQSGLYIDAIANTGNPSCERFVSGISTFEPFATPVLSNDGHNQPFQLGQACCAPDLKATAGRKDESRVFSVATWFDDGDSPIPNGTVTYNRKADVYEICAKCSDSTTQSEGCTLVAVYEGRQGLSIEGKGSFNSPIEAFPSSGSTTSEVPATTTTHDRKHEATFDFHVMYDDDGATRPTGELTFNVRDSFDFRSSSYDWLIVHGTSLAKLFGEGRVAKKDGTNEEQAVFGFMLTISDGSDSDYSSRDKFRIKIWKKKTSDSDHALVYDNMMGSCDGEYDGSTLHDGFVHVHVPDEHKRRERVNDTRENAGSGLRG